MKSITIILRYTTTDSLIIENPIVVNDICSTINYVSLTYRALTNFYRIRHSEISEKFVIPIPCSHSTAKHITCGKIMPDFMENAKPPIIMASCTFYYFGNFYSTIPQNRISCKRPISGFNTRCI